VNWIIEFLPEVEKDISKLSNNQRISVFIAFQKVKTNPLPMTDGGYGKPLGNKHGIDLAGFLKIKLRGEGIRIVYKLIRRESQMLVVVVGLREDDDVYTIAARRRIRHSL